MIIARVIEKTAWMLNSKNDVKTTYLGYCVNRRNFVLVASSLIKCFDTF